MAFGSPFIFQPTGGGPLNAITELIGDVTAVGPGVATATISNNVITNAMISASAAIAYSKLDLTNSITNSDINSSAAIAYSKLAALTASRALQSSGSGFIEVSSVTSTELGYLSGVTSAIQTQINAKMTNPMTTGGDIIYGGASGTPTRLANGSNGQVLTSSGGTSAPTWQTPAGGAVMTSQRLTSGSSTYNTPANCRQIVVEMWGAGGGGGGGNNGTPGTTGGDTTFGTSLLTATGGAGSATASTSASAGAPGTATVNSPAVALISQSGSYGQNGQANIANGVGGTGGAGPYGGAGGGGTGGNAAGAATNSGAGGGGGSTSGAGQNAGHGGSSGGYIKALITTPSSSYSYAVGAAGTAAGGGGGAYNGGNGGSGLIIVYEFY